MFTTTAPSDRPHCFLAKERKTELCLVGTCEHRKCPCTPAEGVDLAEWNPSMGKKMNHLMTLLTRFNGGVRPVYFSPTETQDGKRRVDGIGRMALHKHPLMYFEHQVPNEQEFRKMALIAGFGHEVKVRRLDMNSRAVARYVTKQVAGYVTKSASDRPDVPWRQFRTRTYRTATVDVRTGELFESTVERRELVTKPTYHAYSRSRSWGILMRDVKAAERAKVIRLKEQGWTPGKPPAAAPAAGIVTSSSDQPPPMP
jgi:hypothetical protein